MAHKVVQSSRGPLCTVFVENERPTLTNKMMPMMMACVLSPRKKDSTAVTASSASTALLSWRASTAIALTPWVRTEFGPIEANLVFASAADSPSVEVPNHCTTSATGAQMTRCRESAKRPVGSL